MILTWRGRSRKCSNYIVKAVDSRFMPRDLAMIQLLLLIINNTAFSNLKRL